MQVAAAGTKQTGTGFINRSTTGFTAMYLREAQSQRKVFLVVVLSCYRLVLKKRQLLQI